MEVFVVLSEIPLWGDNGTISYVGIFSSFVKAEDYKKKQEQENRVGGTHTIISKVLPFSETVEHETKEVRLCTCGSDLPWDKCGTQVPQKVWIVQTQEYLTPWEGLVGTTEYIFVSEASARAKKLEVEEWIQKQEYPNLWGVALWNKEVQE
jgi:hypothetical protein